MEEKTIAVSVDSSFKKAAETLAAALENERLVAFIAAAYQHQRFLVVEFFRNLKKKVPGKSVGVNDLLCVGKDKLSNGIRFFDKTARPGYRYISVDVLEL